RNEKQPISQPSCGSVFKRPKGKYAAELIEKAGLKGETIGGARVSEKHAGFIINTGNATSEDVRMLISKIKEVVKEKFNTDLEEEVIYVGSCNGGEV
ncbi:MAG: UDP-N-acetylenolpyruvoylglucosamine reductase, partial [Candidatus Delongbacteria bacterium]